MGLLDDIIKKATEGDKPKKREVKIVPPKRDEVKIEPPKHEEVKIVPPKHEEVKIVAPGQEPAGGQPLTATFHGKVFRHTSQDPPAVWLNEGERSVYISDPDSFVKNGGRIERAPVTSAMDAQMYKVYTPKGQEQQVLYYKPENKLVSPLEDPFAKYRTTDKSADPKYKYKVIAAFQRMTGREVYGNAYDEVIIPELQKRGMSTDELIQKYGKEGD